MKCICDRILLIAAVLLLSVLGGCGVIPRKAELPAPSALVVVSCPELTPLADNTFGATTLKLVEVANQYRECRRAALGAQPTP